MGPDANGGPGDRSPRSSTSHPGGVGQGALRTAVQRPVDQLLYRRCDLLIAASTALVARPRRPIRPARRASLRRRTRAATCRSARTPAGDLRAGRRIACCASATGSRTRVSSNCSTRSPPCLPTTSPCTSSVAPTSTRATPHGCRLDSPLPTSPDASSSTDRSTRQEVAGLYAGADAFVLPSYAETYGTVFAEALTAGLPTVGWRSGNLPNLIEDGKQGCLVEPGDIAGLSRVLHRLATDDEWRRNARRRGATTRRIPAHVERHGRRLLRRPQSARTIPRLNHRTIGPSDSDVDARHARVLHVHPPGDPDRSVQRPRERRLDRADVRDHHHRGRWRPPPTVPRMPQPLCSTASPTTPRRAGPTRDPLANGPTPPPAPRRRPVRRVRRSRARSTARRSRTGRPNAAAVLPSPSQRTRNHAIRHRQQSTRPDAPAPHRPR